MFIEQTEKDIAKRLESKVGTGILVEVLPEREADFRRPFEKGRLSVCYKQSEIEKPRSTNEISQDAEYTVEVVIQSRALRGVHGIYDLADRTERALVGFRTKNGRKMYGVSFKFEMKDDNLWAYIYTFAFKSTIVELPDEVKEPLLDEVTTESVFGNTVTIDPTPET